MLEAKYHLYDSAILDAPIDVVWPVVRDLIQLVPLVYGNGLKECRWIEGGSAEHVPSRYQLTLDSSEKSVLEVVGRSETEHSVTYRLIGQGLGITDYIATFQLRPITTEHGRTFVDWSREFAVVPGNDTAEVARSLASSAQAEVLALKKHFQGTSPSTST